MAAISSDSFKWQNSPQSPATRQTQWTFHAKNDLRNEYLNKQRSESQSSEGSIRASRQTSRLETIKARQNSRDGSIEPDEERNKKLQESRYYRIRKAMFPETIDEPMEIPSTQTETGEETALQKLTEPCLLLKDALINLINYQDDAELAVKAVPELCKLLTSQDSNVTSHAANMIHQLSMKEASLRALVSSPQMSSAITRSLTGTHDLPTMKGLTVAMHNMSEQKQGLYNIFKSGGIPALVKMLSCPIESVVRYALTTLHNLLRYQDGSREAVREAGGAQKMVPLLQNNNPKFLALLTDCLEMLAYNSPETKTIIFTLSGPQHLTRIMTSFDYEKLLWTTSRLLKVISPCPNNKLAILENQGLQALAMHLQHPSQRLVQSCLWTLRNVSDAATVIEEVDELIQTLVHFLKSSENDVVICSVGILSNLTCSNTRNKMTAYDCGAVPALIQIIAEERDEITEPAVCVVRHLTARHPKAELARNSVREHNGLSCINNILAQQLHWPVIKVTIELIQNLCHCSSNHSKMVEIGIVAKVARLLLTAVQETTIRTGSSVTGEQVYQDGIKMDDIIERSIAALHILARDPLNHYTIISMLLIPVFVQLLYSDADAILRVVCGILSELATDQTGAELIEQEGAVAPLTALLDSKNESVATYAAAVIYSLSRDKRVRASVSTSVDDDSVFLDNPPEFYDSATLPIEEKNSSSAKPSVDC